METSMNRNYTIFPMFTVLIGTIAATLSLTTIRIPEGVSCTDQRIASFGFTHKQIALAELAAISTWQDETEKKEPGFGSWHLSHKRSMKCKMFKDSKHFQCIVSARPCRYDRF